MIWRISGVNGHVCSVDCGTSWKGQRNECGCRLGPSITRWPKCPSDSWLDVDSALWSKIVTGASWSRLAFLAIRHTGAPYSSFLAPDSSRHLPHTFCARLLCLTHPHFLVKPRPHHHRPIIYNNWQKVNGATKYFYLTSLAGILFQFTLSFARVAHTLKMQVRY